MAFDEKLAARVRKLISPQNKNTEEKKMFGGLCFMVNDKMCIGVEKERLMVRIDPEKYEEAMKKEGSRPMDFTGKVMKGFVFVDAAAVTIKAKLEYWVNLAMSYNKIAKPSRKKKK
jgi:TfoX/Sxy family transcriptional regulator of competence genes